MTDTLAPRQVFINRLIWYGIIATSALDIAWMMGAGITLDLAQAMIFFPVFALCLIISLFYRYVRRDDRLWLLGHVTNQMLCAATAICILSYLSAGYALPLQDENFIALDRMFFFDWRGWVTWLDTRPWLAAILSGAYMSSGPQIIVMLFLLFMAGQTAHSQRFMLTFLFSGWVVVLFAALFPAMGGYVHYDMDIAQLKHLHPMAARVHEEPMLAMRHHTIHTLGFPLKGLITFPSFHSTLAVLMIYAAWPMRRLRWIALPLNLLVLLSTPGDGGHYLTDVLAGIAIAALVMVMAERLLPRERVSPTKAATR